jgi:hypothetical protein
MDELGEGQNPDDEPAEQPHPERESKGGGGRPTTNPLAEEKGREEEP